MSSKDSYPHADANNGSVIDVKEVSEVVQSEGNVSEVNNENSENDDYRGPEEEIYCECENQNNEKNEETKVSESKIVVDDETEEYESETTGIKLEYSLKPDEVEDFIKQSEEYEKNVKGRRKSTVMLLIALAGLLVSGFLSANKYYLLFALFPVISIVSIWLIPQLGIKKLVGDILNNNNYSVEVFPDKIEVDSNNIVREIPLDGSCESLEFENMIFIFSERGLDLIIPLRAVEEDFKADVQAMILAGTNPRYSE